MPIALICDWLTGMRGGERCLEAVCELYPDAEIFTLVHFPGSVSQTIESHKIHTSYIQQLPCDSKTFRRYLPLFPDAIQKFDLSGYDCVVSFSHCVAKGVKANDHAPHICYCHTPMRYAWHMRDEYLVRFSYLKRLMAELILDHMKNWDRKTSLRVTRFIANSKNTQNRIKQNYGRDSDVIYPPVDCDRFQLCKKNDGFYLVVSALVPYKHVDIAVKAFSSTSKRLVVVGDGPELAHLKSIASANVSFVNGAGDNDVVEYMQKCTALIFPGEEDFGIVPLEAQSCGKSVIALAKGGALETVIPNETGIFFDQQTPQALLEAISAFEKNKELFDPYKCRENALRFDRPVYQRAMQAYIQSVIGQ